jgi:hypothetical protein
MLAVSAVTATVAGDVLTLVGDDLDSSISLRVDSSAVVVTPGSDTRINGGDPGVAVTLQGVVRSLRADLKGGDDSLAADTAVPFSLPGGVTVQLGSGNNQMQFATPGQKIMLGPVSIAAGIGSNEIQIASQAGGTVTGAMTIKLGDGANRVSLENVAVTGPRIALSTGDGRDQVAISGLSGTAALAVVAGLGSALVQVTDSTLGALSVSAEQPDVSVTTSTLAAASVAGQFDTRLAMSRSKVSGAVTASSTATGGDVTVLLESYSLGGNLSATTTGGGADVRLTLDAAGGAATSTGNLLARATGQDSAITLTVNSAVSFSTGKTLALQATGSGGQVQAILNGELQAKSAAFTCQAGGVAGTVDVQNKGGFAVSSATFAAWGDVTVAGADATTSSIACTNDMRVQSGRGTAAVTVPAALDVRGLSVAGRDASFFFGGTARGADEIRGALLVSGQRQADVAVGPGGRLEVLGSLTCKAGLDATLRAEGVTSVLDVRGGCTIQGTNVETTIGASGQIGGAFAATGKRRTVTTLLSGDFVFAQQASVTGGTGDDSFESAAGVEFRNKLSLRLGNGQNRIAVTGDPDPAQGPTVAGALTIATGTGADQISFVDAMLAGTIACTTGGGADEFSATKATTFGGNVTLAMDTGYDKLYLGISDNGSAPVTFQGTLTANLGAENDLLRLGVALTSGGDANSRVVFAKTGSTIQGGPGVNVFEPVQSQYTGLPDGSIIGFASTPT